MFESNPTSSSSKAYIYEAGRQFLIAASSSLVPGRLRLIDIDFDGFIDVVVTLVNADSTTTTYVLDNFASNSTADS